MRGEGREEKGWEGREEGRGIEGREGRGGLSGNVTEEAFCLKSAPGHKSLSPLSSLCVIWKTN